MDPNLNYNFAYGDNYGTGTDHTSDPVNHYGWTTQWSQPPSAAAAPAANAKKLQFPQYVSQQQQQQQQQPHQQQQTPGAYSNLNPLSSFMQQQQKPPGQFQQKKFGQQGAPKAANHGSYPFGAGTGANAMNMLGRDWVTPPSQNAFGGFNRPFNNQGGQSKMQFFGQPQMSKGNWKNKNKAPAPPRKFDTAGKTPAMVLHELFKTIGEDYSEVNTVPKRYRCTLTVNGREFQMESANKKAAKQKCAELVIRDLRPDLHLTPFEEGVTAKAVPVVSGGVPVDGNGQAGKRNLIQAASMLNPAPAAQKKASIKKAKLTPVESALSLLDLMQKVIAESQVKYTPVFEAHENPKMQEVKQEVNEEVKQEGVETPENSENEKKGAWRKNDAQHTVTLKFADQGKEYSKSGANRGILKDMVVREALRDLFQLSQEDITTVARRHASNRLGSDMTIIQCLHTICTILNCSVTLECEPAEDRPLGEGRLLFTGKCSIIDHTENDKEFNTKSPSLPSKAIAKEFAAQEMLRNYFKIDPTTCVKGDGVTTQGPCAVLHAMLNKQTRQRTKINYEFKDNVPAVAGQPATVFYCDCVIDDKDRYTGNGRSKKLAKNEAAMLALKKIFNIDFDPSATYPLALSNRVMTEQKVSNDCRTIAEFCKREYHQMTEYYQVQPSNQIACFLLVNEHNEKRLLSMGSSVQYVVEPDTLNGANGSAVIHLDPIVLARRSLIRYLLQELEILETNPGMSVFDKKEGGKAALKSNMKLVLYSNFSPVCTYAVDDAETKSLALVTPTNTSPVPSDVLTLEEIRANKTLRIHCTADKVFKWSVLGVQGALLSNIIHPIFISQIYFGSEVPVSDESLKFALQGRLGPAESEREILVESMPLQMRIHAAYSQAWYRGSDSVEVLDYNTGRTNKGSRSKLCKAEIFDAYRRVNGVDLSIVDYSKAKENASEYQYEKRVFYGKMEAAGLGKWQTKPPGLIDSFTLAAFD
ncbi:unnamed protein product [Caenorhabditis sp. 36 PRJEB53466]|nr:unnamed protein product [Caenorhabditis sp. 36 PRJEB53466]